MSRCSIDWEGMIAVYGAFCVNVGFGRQHFWVENALLDP